MAILLIDKVITKRRAIRLEERLMRINGCLMHPEDPAGLDTVFSINNYHIRIIKLFAGKWQVLVYVK